MLRQRVNEHRAMFYKILKNPNIDFSLSGDPDSYCLGRHLIEEHNCIDRNDFNSSYKIFILCNSSPRSLDVNEHRWIQRLKSIKPFGINSVDPFGPERSLRCPAGQMQVLTIGCSKYCPGLHGLYHLNLGEFQVEWWGQLTLIPPHRMVFQNFRQLVWG